MFMLVQYFAPIQVQGAGKNNSNHHFNLPTASKETIAAAFKEFESLYNTFIEKYPFLINQATSEPNLDENTIQQIIKLGANTYSFPNELEIETLKPCHDAFITKTIDSTCKPLTVPGIYLGVGYLRTWWTVMQLPNDFHAMILLNREIAICLFNAFERLLLLISHDYAHYQTFFKDEYDKIPSLNLIDRFATLNKAYQINFNMLCMCHFLSISQGIYDAIITICKEEQSTLPQAIQSSSKSIQWAKHKITPGKYHHLKYLANTESVHIVNTDLLNFQAIEPILNNYATQGLYLKLIGVSNIMLNPINWILAWIKPKGADPITKTIEDDARAILEGHYNYQMPIRALLEWLEKCHQHQPAGHTPTTCYITFSLKIQYLKKQYLHYTIC
jgi:hypothetical protein